MDIVNGMPTGCVRISFGYMSTWKDVEIFLRFLRECFQGTPSQLSNQEQLLILIYFEVLLIM